MSDEKTSQDEASPPERRFLLRFPSNAGAVVIRETDAMRSGIDGTLKDVSSGGLGLYLTVPLDENENIKIVLRNEVQRVEKEVRGIVRHVTPAAERGYHVGIELHSRLTPLEVSLLKMGMDPDLPPDAPLSPGARG